ncbi:hypothetical protein CBW46_004835 [Paenibacillus xerothermodurans]|uniref:Uncharacterized protein n=2 Tax=Paenibacillus xerothermodurans TaxID=1977292 RepID=A0A2W1NWT8_PAEXE|nr:hypothetical protein CBW46_004835 [Paenibacillus xerothermodurans]
MRFIERDYYKHLMMTNSEEMTESQIDKILDTTSYTWADLTFKFFENGSMTIIDNHTDLQLSLSDLRGAAYDFYVRQRIGMIRANLEAKILQSAS